MADEGGGARDLAPLSGHPAFAAHIGRSLAADEFDMSFSRDRGLGQALRRAVETYQEDPRIAVIATAACHTRGWHGHA